MKYVNQPLNHSLMEETPLKEKQTFFAPMLALKAEDGVAALEFYKNAFGAIELRRFTNEDGSVHVGELSINGALFHFHEESAQAAYLSPGKIGGNSTIIGLFVPDPDVVIERAVKAGAKLINAPKDYEYGYRQGRVMDPFGHVWEISRKIGS
jgi:PhnB protein